MQEQLELREMSENMRATAPHTPRSVKKEEEVLQAQKQIP